VATVIAVAIVTVKAQTTGDVRTREKAYRAAGDEANGAADEGTRGRAERAVEHPLSGARRSRRRQRHDNDYDRNNLSHDFPSRMSDDGCQMTDVR
jgi:hypothetical protein